MPATPEVDALVERLLGVYVDAWDLVEAELRALADDPVRFARRRRLREMQASIEAAMDDADAQARLWLGQDFSEVYALGGQVGASSVGERFAWAEQHTSAVVSLADDLFGDLLSATRGVRLSTKRLVREIARKEVVRTVVGGETGFKASRLMSDWLADHGVYSVRYKNGARVALDTYAEMAVRTKSAVAYNTGTLKAGPEWYEVIDGPGCGWVEHSDPEQALGKIVDRDTALGNPISHPQCRRVFGPRPDIGSAAEASRAKGSVEPGQVAAQRVQDAARRSLQARRPSGAQRMQARLDRRLRRIARSRP